MLLLASNMFSSFGWLSAFVPADGRLSSFAITSSFYLSHGLQLQTDVTQKKQQHKALFVGGNKSGTSLMTKDNFLKLLRHSSTVAHDFAKNYVLDELPVDCKYSLTLNASSDDPSLMQFDIYPNENGKVVELVEEEEVVELLCRKDKVPVWIDISVESVFKGKTIFRLLCAGRYSDNENEFYYNNNGTGPFGVKSPNLPIGYIEGKKFRLKAKIKKSIFSWLTNN